MKEHIGPRGVVPEIITLRGQAMRARFLGVGTSRLGLGGVHILRQNEGPCDAWLRKLVNGT